MKGAIGYLLLYSCAYALMAYKRLFGDLLKIFPFLRVLTILLNVSIRVCCNNHKLSHHNKNIKQKDIRKK